MNTYITTSASLYFPNHSVTHYHLGTPAPFESGEGTNVIGITANNNQLLIVLESGKEITYQGIPYQATNERSK